MSKGFDYDLLLSFLSEKGEGSWKELKDAWTWVLGPSEDPADKAWVIARDFAALGHIEIAWTEQRWCIAPPLITMIPRSGGRVFVTGARTLHFRTELEKVAEALDLWIDECGRGGAPKSIFVACRSHSDAERLARDVGAGYTYQVAEQIAGILPPLEMYEGLYEERPLPMGLESELFDPDKLQWKPITAFDMPGLYRCRTHEGHIHGLLDATSRWKRIVRELGVYEVLRWADVAVLSYSEKDATLSVPAQASLPTLHARAATLCSGRLPAFSYIRNRGVLTYHNVPARVAHQIAVSLRQRIQEEPT